MPLDHRCLPAHVCRELNVSLPRRSSASLIVFNAPRKIEPGDFYCLSRWEQRLVAPAICPTTSYRKQSIVENRLPAQPSLCTFEGKKLEEEIVVVNGHTPFQ